MAKSAAGAIDAHHHLWDPGRGDYPWMTERYAPIRRVFTAEDLRPELVRAGIERTIIVQSWASIAETEELLQVAEATDFIAGVVGWIDLCAADAGRRLDALRHGPGGRWLVGIRHQVHDEPDPAWLLRPEVRRGLAAVAERGLAYDLLVRPRELPAALSVVDEFPQLRFVIDHIAKPNIRAGGFASWSEALRPFGGRDNVWCKLSGAVTEANWSEWRPEDIRPYFAEAIAIFGPVRCMLGSDWPVCLLAASYGRTIGLVRDSIQGLDAASRDALMRGAAIAAYRLDVSRH